VHYRADPGWPAPVVVAQPRPGDFVCVPISGPVGVGVTIGQWLDGDRFQFYDHTEVYVGRANADGPFGYTVSTYPNGQGKRALPCQPKDLPGSLWSAGLIGLTGTQRTGIVEWALAHQDTGYGFLDYGALILHGLHVPAPGLRAYIASTHRLICSQYVDAAYRINGVNLFEDGRWEGYVKPGDLAQLLQSRLREEPPRRSTRWMVLLGTGAGCTGTSRRRAVLLLMKCVRAKTRRAVGSILPGAGATG
jgi:hypothetical protein